MIIFFKGFILINRAALATPSKLWTERITKFTRNTMSLYKMQRAVHRNGIQYNILRCLPCAQWRFCWRSFSDIVDHFRSPGRCSPYRRWIVLHRAQASVICAYGAPCVNKKREQACSPSWTPYTSVCLGICCTSFNHLYLRVHVG
jgi:hypothetical protein